MLCRTLARACEGGARLLPRPRTAGRAGVGAGSSHRLRGFATSAFTVKGDSGERTIFVFGLNEGKFFGPDSAEGGLKLLERIAEHSKKYQLLLGITEKELQVVEEDHAVKNKLTPSRELEGKRVCEFIPLIQASMVDENPRMALGRSLRSTQGQFSMALFKYPRETVKLYRLFWRRKQYKDAASWHFLREHLPMAAVAYFDQRAGTIALRTLEQLARARVLAEKDKGPLVLVVGNDIFELVVRDLREILDSTAPEKLGSEEFLQDVRTQAAAMAAEGPDPTPLLLIIYLGLPLLLLQNIYLAIEYRVNRSGVLDEALAPDQERD